MARNYTKRTPKPETLGMTSDCTALYLRVSTAAQVDGFSLEAQRTKLDAYCVAMGWAACPAHVYIDAGESGKSTDRPAFNAMLRAAHNGEVARIVAIKLDRVARNVKAFLDLVDELTAIDVDLVLMAESFDTSTPNGKFALTVFAALAELERSTITDRVMSGKKEKARQGGYNGSRIPYGYTYANGQFAIDADAATTVKAIFDDFLAGSTMADIARRLDREGYPTSMGGAWATNTVRTILRNGAYAGLSQWDGVEESAGVYPAIISATVYSRTDARLRSLKPGKPARVA